MVWWHYSPCLDPCGSCSSPNPGTPVTPPLPAELHMYTNTHVSLGCWTWWEFLLTPQHFTSPVKSKWRSWTNATVQFSSLLSHEFPTGACFKTRMKKRNHPERQQITIKSLSLTLSLLKAHDHSVVLQPLMQARSEIIHMPSTSCVYCTRIVASPPSFYSSLQPQRPHLNYTGRDLPQALRGFCLSAFLQKLSPSARTQGKRGFVLPILSLSPHSHSS